MIIPKPISGFKEYLPEEEKIQKEIIKIIETEYNIAGFIEIDTSIIERNKILLAKGGLETKEIYTIGKMGDKKEKEFSLRFDQTIPFARYVAQNYGKLIYPFKRYQIGKVYRGERPADGRFREFYQADIDIIGDKTLSLSYDAEIISIINNIFKKINIGKFQIRINNRKLQLGLIEEYNITNTGWILKTLDKLDKLPKEEIFNLLKEKLEEKIAQKLIDFATLERNNKEVIKSFSNNELYQEGVKELIQVIEEANLMGVEKENIIIDTSIARGLDYYTGTIYETYIEADKNIGSVCSGGRYENLASEYTKQKLPGVGISIGVSRLVYSIIKNKLKETPTQKNAEYLVFTNRDKEKMLKVVKKMRNLGMSCEISFLDSYKKEIKLAQKKGYTKIVFAVDYDDRIIIRDLLKDRKESDTYIEV